METGGEAAGGREPGVLVSSPHAMLGKQNSHSRFVNTIESEELSWNKSVMMVDTP